MCGIFGGTPDLIATDVERLLFHRGPDQQGRVVVQGAGGPPVVIGQTRLNVVYKKDVPTPMQRYGAVIAFNGEIYNWGALRRELEAKGYRFETPTDTEVVLCAYLEWGPACLDRMNGMFAVAIWHDERLFLARDRMGKKPLFYAHGPRGLGFASELKAFAELDFAEVPICQALEFYFDQYTPFRNVQSLKPGGVPALDAAHERGRAPDVVALPGARARPARRRARHRRVPRALHRRLRHPQGRRRAGHDLPLGRHRLVAHPGRAALSRHLHGPVLRVRRDDQRAALRHRVRRAPRLRAAHRDADAHDFLETFPELARFIEFPVGSQSVLPLFCLARQARRDGFVVALSGEGSDELFNGYYRNELLLREEESLAGDFAGVYGTLCRRYFGAPLERFCRMVSRQGLAGVPLLLDFFAPRWRPDRTFAQNLSVIESTVFLQPLLVMADRLSMGNSLEVRNPFLDYRLVEFSARLADGLKFRDGQGKWLLRQALRRLVGPDLGIVTRPVKHGLPAPVNQWLFKSSAFDRKDWNQLLFGECLKQLARAHDPTH